MRVGCRVRPSREFAPAGDLLSCVDKKVGKEATPAPSPLRFAAGSPAMLAPQGSRGTHFATLRSNSCAESVHKAGFARASGSCASRLLQRGTPEQPKTEQPTSKPGSRLAPAVRDAPFSTAEQRKDLKPRAKRASRTDSAQLSDRSVAEGVLRGASRPEQRRAPTAQRAAVRSGGSLCLLSGGPESRSPAGAKSRYESHEVMEVLR